MTQTFTAKTVEEAKAQAVRAFGAAESEITFEILEEPKKGFLGFKKGEAKVRATYVSIDVSTDDHRAETKNEVLVPPVVEYDEVSEDVTEEKAPAEETVAEEEPAEEAVSEESVEEIVAEETPAEEAVAEEPVEEIVAEETPAEEAVAEEPVEEIVAEETPAEEVVAEESVAEETVVETPVQETARVLDDEEIISGEPSEAALAKIEAAKAYLSEVFRNMGVEAEFQVTAGAESAIINIVTANSGSVIGRRGDTLDSLQYLTFLVANRGDKEYYRIILNSADYRERRRKTLEELAVKIAKNVIRTGRTQSLEPMNPYERRIVHSAISGMEGVSSRSVGDEPYRKVVISSTSPKPVRHKKRYDKTDSGKDGGRNGRGNRDDRSRRDHKKNSDQPERISMDSMKTSFEKDYKRPKAEDEINAGLYGKIEF